MSLGMGILTTNRRNRNSHNHVTLSYKTVNVSALEIPYKTGCRRKMANGQPYSKQDCFVGCLMRLTHQKFQKVPFSILIQEPVEMLTITSSQISNDSFSDSLSRIEIECSSKCKDTGCDYDYTMTYSSYQEREELHFVVTAPSEPTVRIEFQKQMDLNDLIYYSMSLLSFWFGISVISFNPAPFIASHYPSCARKQEVERENCGSASKFCKNTRTNLLRGLKSELKFLSGDIFIRDWKCCPKSALKNEHSQNSDRTGCKKEDVWKGKLIIQMIWSESFVGRNFSKKRVWRNSKRDKMAQRSSPEREWRTFAESKRWLFSSNVATLRPLLCV